MTLRSAPYRIGLSASLSRGESVHRETFLRAVEMARAALEASGVRIELRQICDGADEEHGHEAAEALVSWGAQVVVGHYASAAARGARDIYRAAGVPLLLPAATADALVEPGSNVFRVCRPDRAFAAAVVEDLRKTHGIQSLVLSHDGTFHGEALSAAIQAAGLRAGGPVCWRAGIGTEADAELFVGQFPASVAFVRQRLALSRGGLLVLTDDAATPALAEALPVLDRPVAVYGFCPAERYPRARSLVAEHLRRWASSPGVYFLETYAALEIIAQYLSDPAAPRRRLSEELRTRSWRTALGDLRFSDNEGGVPCLGKWLLRTGCLQLDQVLWQTTSRGS